MVMVQPLFSLPSRKSSISFVADLFRYLSSAFSLYWVCQSFRLKWFSHPIDLSSVGNLASDLSD